jgi:hypothetical protein
VPTFQRAQITLVGGQKFQGDLVRLVGDTLTLGNYETPSGDVFLPPRSLETARHLSMVEVARLEIRRRHTAAGAGIGAFAVVGALLLSATNEDGYDGAFVGTGAAIGAIMVAAGLGAGVGALIGSAFTHWETVYEPESGFRLDSRFEYRPGVGYRRKVPEDQ